MRTLLSAVSLLSLLHAQPSLAFHLGDHQSITETAVSEVERCTHAQIPVGIFVDTVLAEDIDLVRKWLKYSHYYNPNKTLDMRRADSSVTIKEIEGTLREKPESSDYTWGLMGRAVHHIQDMAVPSHVVPISHWLNDQFEGYSATTSEDASCDWLADDETQNLTLMDILHDTAEDTLSALEKTVDLKSKTATWKEAFWTPSTDHSFGTYGFLGNRFGKTSISIGKMQYQISNDNYQSFKTHQLELAKVATRRAILWFLHQQAN